ncbi:hypothetical protein DXT99_12195 [Pontibacter diazotrophicus]|uniref:Uncharacterized protein n=1 Tax=Pontibacter diazotrophicus TaxID=1400979 RepID=A0A3D8LCM8_9BACT|nr:hypothetical protein DXT99_12195 [Pontibacter diazotrophicus]
MWRVSQLQEEANAHARKIEEAIIGYQTLAEEKDWVGTLFLGNYMRVHLMPEQYRLWREMEE